MATILIVDDRPVNREFLVTLLGYGGHRLLEAVDGVQGLAVVRAERPDLVIADVLMPTMDGYEFVRRLRADPAVAGTRVIFYTAHYHEPQARKLAADCGVSDVLTKPSDPALVLRTVEAALGHAAPPTPPAEEFDREHLDLLTDKLSEKADELRRTNERLTALVELGLKLGSERDPHTLLQVFCDAAREIVGARYAVVGVPDEGASYRQLMTSGMDVALAARVRGSGPLAGVLGSVLAAGRCFRVSNHGGLEAAGVPPTFPGASALLAAPVVSPARVYGWVCLLDRVGADAFSDEDERLARMLAAQVGRIYENGSLYADLLHHSSKLTEEVAERKRAEEGLRRSEVRFRNFVEQASDGFFLHAGDGTILDVNRRACNSLGYMRDELVGLGVTDIDPEATPAEFGRVAAELAAGREITLETRHRRKDGSSFPVEVRLSPFESDGQPLCLALVRDMTRRKQAEEALRLRDRAIQAVTQGILITDPTQPDNPIIYASPGFVRLTGYPADEVVGRNCRFLQGPETDPEATALVREAVRLGRPCSVELLNYRKDRTAFWNALAVSPVHDEAGRLTHFVGIQRDVTERRRLEEQFRQAQKMEAVGQLAGGVAHDFNNLLQVITGYGDLILGSLPEGAPAREMLAEMVKAGERAAGLTRQLLAFSRHQVLAPRLLDLNEVVRDLEKMLRRLIGEDVDLGVSLRPDLGRVRADPGQVEQVLMNLAVNARDAMPRGGKLTIETQDVELDEGYAGSHAGARPGPHVLLAVSDTGHGMTPEVKARLFEPFFTTKGVGKGTGLGLAVVHGVVKQSGGHIDVYSEPGVGTTFKIYLPRAGEAAAEEARTPVTAASRGSETVLLVEDEDAVRTLGRIILNGAGYAVLEASDGEEAVRVAERHEGPIHLMVTDVVMPGLGGREAAERMLASRPDLKVLFLSGYTEDAVIRHGVLQERVHFLQKPFLPAALAKKVREVLDACA